MARSSMFKIRLTAKELEEAESIAKSYGITVSELFRSRVFARSPGLAKADAIVQKVFAGRVATPLDKQCPNCLRKYGVQPECGAFCLAQRKAAEKAAKEKK